MRNALRIVAGLAAFAGLAACGNQPEQPDNRVGSIAENGPIAEVEALPPDESAATPSDELANGATEAPEANTAY